MGVSFNEMNHAHCHRRMCDCIFCRRTFSHPDQESLPWPRQEPHKILLRYCLVCILTCGLSFQQSPRASRGHEFSSYGEAWWNRIDWPAVSQHLCSITAHIISHSVAMGEMEPGSQTSASRESKAVAGCASLTILE